MNKLFNKYTRLSLTCLVLCLIVSSKSWAKQTEYEGLKGALGFKWDVSSLANNYSSVYASVDYFLSDKVSVEFGAGSVYRSERYVVSAEDMTHKNGYELRAEGKYFLSKESGPLSGVYLGVGLGHLSAAFETEYIVKFDIAGGSYYQNFTIAYETKVHEIFAKIGYRYMTQTERFFLEAGISIGYVNKSTSPQPEIENGRIVSNSDLFNQWDDYPLPMGVEFKLGFLILK